MKYSQEHNVGDHLSILNMAMSGNRQIGMPSEFSLDFEEVFLLHFHVKNLNITGNELHLHLSAKLSSKLKLLVGF